MHHPRILASIHIWHIPQQVKCAQTTVTGVNTHSITAVQRKSAIFGLYSASESFCRLPQCYLAFPALSISIVSVLLFSLHRTCNSAAFFTCLVEGCASAPSALSLLCRPLRIHFGLRRTARFEYVAPKRRRLPCTLMRSKTTQSNKYILRPYQHSIARYPVLAPSVNDCTETLGSIPDVSFPPIFSPALLQILSSSLVFSDVRASSHAFRWRAPVPLLHTPRPHT
ncbi:hypothetical protein EJF18_20019 [Clavispora lusitaniae]|uniref:Uncharacterized protein n=1 Tax=Clavispora lusitaniae TaxID=36911 RepID=A0ACD0WFQ7_CLALS|nr:hypothetical protein EJF14_20019 [Clavispora lusitaniae]QFZ31792.1 hypothetical protein EJF16_20019 [Clavispora lusitaniae]QFZ37461.1 hypothetical protein EJF15_20019 [Clavispora lusitaniae]QFZ43145.1 hypothetical protein EJF18_20019 [Clavispora lusitaniae]QFZ48821.1 hypothetical protein EJF17_20019 [Clavispora lusitaniae]